MKVYIYGDMIIVLNLLMNCLILFVTSKICRQKIKTWRFILASLTGAFYVLFTFYPWGEFLNLWFYKVLLSVLMVLICFMPERLATFIKEILYFYVISFIMGGGAFAVFYLTDAGTLLTNGFYYVQSSIPWWVLAFAAVFLYFFLKFGVVYIRKFFINDSFITDVSISIKNQECYIKALIDTGLSLTDPVTQNPVMVVEYESLNKVLPDDMKKIFLENSEVDITSMADINQDCDTGFRFRLIPYASLGKSNGMLIGFKPDHIKIQIKNETYIKDDIVIGVYNGMFTSDGTYKALMGPEVLSM